MSEPIHRLTPEAVVWATDGGETVALDLSSGGYLGVNSSGTLLWDALAAGATMQTLADRLRDEYGLDPARAEADARGFVEACRARGFLVD